MPSLQIKHVPDEVHRVLRRRAADAGQSLQEYMLARLVEQTSSPTLDDVFGRVARRDGGSVGLADAVRSVRADRDRG